jgi:pimeloyl-ACP methyl ester carboxylesterase
VPLVDVNDIKMYYSTVGDHCDIPLILVPGLRGDSISFGNIIPRIKHYCQLVSIDNRGAGRTVINENQFTTDEMADDIVSLLDHLNVEKANFLGHSMGGFIVQKLALAHPKRVNKIILSCTAPYLTDRSKVLLCKFYDEIISNQITHREFNKRILKFFNAPLISENAFMLDAMLDFMDKYPYRQSIQYFKKQVDACINHHITSDELQNISAQSLVIAGDLDTVVGIDDVTQLVRGINNSALKVIDGVGHLPYLEDSKKFVDIVTTFLFDRFSC